MAEVTALVLAEEKFNAGEVEVALKLANLAKNLSNSPNVDKYRAAYKVHLLPLQRRLTSLKKLILLCLASRTPMIHLLIPLTRSLTGIANLLSCCILMWTPHARHLVLFNMSPRRGRSWLMHQEEACACFLLLNVPKLLFSFARRRKSSSSCC